MTKKHKKMIKKAILIVFVIVLAASMAIVAIAESDTEEQGIYTLDTFTTVITDGDGDSINTEGFKTDILPMINSFVNSITIDGEVAKPCLGFSTLYNIK